MTRRSWLLLIALGSLWGGSYMLIEIGLRDLSAELIVFARTALAALVLLPFALRTRALAGFRPRLAQVVVLAVLQVAAPFLLISLGQGSITSSLAGILVASAPIFTVLLAIPLDHEERVGAMGALGVALGICGVALLVGLDAGDSRLAGALAVVMAGLCYALSGFYVKKRVGDLDTIGLVTATMVASAALTLPLALATLPDSAPAAGPVLAVLTLGFAGTGLAFVVFYGVLASVGPTRASVVAYIVPGFAVIYGVTLLGEDFAFTTAAGLALIVGGSWLAAHGRAPLPA